MSIRTALLRRTGALRDGREFLIRPARGDDALALVALRDGVAAEGGLIAATPGERTPLEEELSLTALLSEGGLGLVAEVASEVVGHLLVQRRIDRAASRVADLAIIVKNGCRDVGLGRSLIETALDWCRAVSVEHLSLAVFLDNDRAIHLYRTLGFQEEGVRHAQVHLRDGDRDVLVMGRSL